MVWHDHNPIEPVVGTFPAGQNVHDTSGPHPRSAGLRANDDSGVFSGMPGYTTVLAAILPVFLLMGLGALLRSSGRLTPDADQSIMRMVVQVFYPALILRYILGNAVLTDFRNLLFAPALAFATICLGFAIAWGIGRLLGLRRGAGHRTFAFTGGIHNYGYIAIPVIIILFPDDQKPILGVLFLYTLGVEVAIWTAGIILVSGHLNRNTWRRLFNPPIMTLAVAVFLTLTGIAPHIPAAIHGVIDFLAQCAIPLGIILAGTTLADLIAKKSDFIRPVKVPLGACFHRLALMPVIILAGALFLPNLTPELRTVLVVQAAMPAGIFPIVISRHYGGHELTAIQVVLATSVVSLLTTPLWIGFGMRLLGA